MKIFIQLADYAQEQAGEKVNAIGLGWSRTGTPLGIHSVVLMIEPAPEDLGREIKLNVRLVNEEMLPVADKSGNNIEIKAELQTPKSETQTPSPIISITPVVLTLSGGLPLKPGIFHWQVTSPQFPEDKWSRSFLVTSMEEATKMKAKMAGITRPE